MASSTFASVFSPKPVTVRSRPSSAATFSASRVEMPSASWTALIFGRLSTGDSSRTPEGNRDFNFSSCALRPVVAISVMVDASAAPIPGTSVSRPSRASTTTSSRSTSTARAPRS